MTETILAINAGSSSLKFSIYEQHADLRLLASGVVTDVGGIPTFAVKVGDVKSNEVLPITYTHKESVRHILGWIEKRNLGAIAVVVHRVVHGGSQFKEPVIVTPEVMQQLYALTPLAPLHQLHNLAAIDILDKLNPGIPQIACFDTAFHAGHTPIFSCYAIPQNLTDKGIRRYGFFGLSYEWITHVMRRDHPTLAVGRVIVAHLGNGAGLCAMKDGVSIDTTMGMTALEGLPMGTRCGNLDPGAVIFMIRDLKISPDEVEHILYNDSGLKGMSGITNNVKHLEDSSDPKAKFALDYFSLRIAQFIGMMAVAVGGMDALVFTGGIGEHAAGIRQKTLQYLDFLKPFETLVIPANEEGIMAGHAFALMQNKPEQRKAS
jgi:acetate kinase